MKPIFLYLLVCLGIIVLSSGCKECGPNGDGPNSLNIMTFNIRFNNPDDGVNAWPNRKEMVASIIGFHQVAIVGVQEALHDQVVQLDSLLPDFDWIGVGRDDGRNAGEYSAIFYRSGRFIKEDGGNFWLSQEPWQAGTLGWDAACVRICTWLKLTDKRTHRTFYVFNTHFDHIGVLARRNSAKLIREKINEIANTAPVILCGDFNCTNQDESYKTLTAKETIGLNLSDAGTLSMAKPYGSRYSYNAFQDSVQQGIIDFIFVSDKIDVLRHGVISERWDGCYPSDHFPVLAEIKLP